MFYLIEVINKWGRIVVGVFTDRKAALAEAEKLREEIADQDPENWRVTVWAGPTNVMLGGVYDVDPLLEEVS